MCLGALQLVLLLVPHAPEIRAEGLATVFKEDWLPQQLGDWQRIEFRAEDRERSSDEGQYSRCWVYQSENSSASVFDTATGRILKQYSGIDRCYGLAFTKHVPGANYWQKKAWLLGELGQEQQAEQAIMKSVQVAPANPWSWFHRGKFWRNRKKWSEALADFDRAEGFFFKPPQELRQLQADCRDHLGSG